MKKITNYFEKKEIEVSEITKKTFSDISREIKTRSINDRIKNFEEFQSVRGGKECILVGGRCVKHKIKLTRELNRRRTSHTNKNGEVSWTMREVSILVCPMAGQLDKGDDVTITSQPVGGGSTNKKQRLITMNENDPITVSSTASEELRLDTNE